MADNSTLDAGAGGDTIVTRELSHGGDTAKLPGTFVMGISGNEGAYTAAAINGDATNGLDVDVTRVGGTVTVDGSGVTQPVSNAGLTELAAAINSNRVDVNIAASGATVTVDGSGVTQPVSHAALTELAAAINASSQMDVNLAASNATVAVSNAGLTELAAAINGSSQLDVNVAAGTVAVTHAALTELGSALVAEDVAHQSGDLGLMALAVRQSSQSDFGADGDYVPLSIDDDGGLRVSIVAGAGSGGTAAADDADFTDGTTQGTPAMGVYEATPTTVTDGDLGVVGITEERALKVHIAGSDVSSSGGTSTADDADFSAGTTAGTIAQGVYESSPSSVTDGDVGAVGITQTRALRTVVEGTAAVSNAGLTELAAAINGSSQLDVNIAASNATVAVSNAGLTAINGATATLGTSTYTEATTTGVVIGAVRRDADTTLVNTTNEVAPLIVDANGYLKVEIFDGGGSHTVDNGGTFAVQVDGAALTALQLIDNTIFVDDAQFTAGTSSVSAIGLIADEASTDSVDENDVGIPRMTLDRKQITTTYAHAAAGGATPFYNLDADETEDAIKASAGKLMSLGAINRSTGVRYLKFYNATTANVTVGTTTPVLVIPLPTMADTNGAGIVLPIPDCGIQFDTAITVAATTGFADNDTGAPGANDVIVFGAYI